MRMSAGRVDTCPRRAAGETSLTSLVTDVLLFSSQRRRALEGKVVGNNMVTCLPLSRVSWTPGCLVRTLPCGRPDGGVGGRFGRGGVAYLGDLVAWCSDVTGLNPGNMSVCVCVRKSVREYSFDTEVMLTSSSSRFILRALLLSLPRLVP